MNTSTHGTTTVEANEFCQMQPAGWFCTLRAGHDGKCSAHRHLPDGDLDPVVEANRELLRTRSAVGIQKYGMTLADADLSLSELLTHLLEELLDGANYAQAGLQRAKAAESLLLQDGERYRVDAMRVLRRCIEDEKRGWTGQEQKAVHYALESLLDRFRVQVERGAIHSPAGQDAKAEPLKAERIDWLANCACADGVAYPHNVKAAINSALKESGPTISVQQKISEPIGYISRGAIEHALSQGIGASTYISAAQTDEFPVAVYPAPQAAAEGVGRFVISEVAKLKAAGKDQFSIACCRIDSLMLAAPERAAIQTAGETADLLIPRLQSFLDRLCNDTRAAAMFEGDSDTLRDAIGMCRYAARSPVAVPDAEAIRSAALEIPFKLFEQELPKLVEHSSSYGGQWNSEWCAVLDHNGNISMARFTVSESEKLAIDSGNRKHIHWRPNGSWANYKAWAYQSEIRALSQPSPAVKSAETEYLKAHSDSWMAVMQTLQTVASKWMAGDGLTGAQQAVAAIHRLVAAAEAQNVWELSDQIIGIECNLPLLDERAMNEEEATFYSMGHRDGTKEAAALVVAVKSAEPTAYNPLTQPGDPNFDGAEAFEAHLRAEPTGGAA